MKKLLTLLFLLAKPILSTAQIDFVPFHDIPVGSSPEVVAIADLNNDGRKDIVLGTDYYSDPLNDYKLFVFIQNYQGNLNTPIKYPYPNSFPGIRSLTVADVNNDNLNDVIIGYVDSIGIYFQNSSGTLNGIQSYYSGTRVDGTKCGDLNNDGLTDIAVSHWNDNFIKIFYQTSGGFSTATYPKPDSGFDEIDVGDVNGDGLDDVVFMAGSYDGGIHVFTQNTSGTLNNYVSYFPSSSNYPTLNGIAIGDLNNDGKNDVAASLGGNYPNCKIILWYQNPITGLLQNPPIKLNCLDIPESIEIADLNCDNRNEIIIAHGGWLAASVFEQDGTGGYNNCRLFGLPDASHYNPYGLSVDDFNLDAKNDIAIADYNHGLVLLRNDSKPAQFDTLSITVNADTVFKKIHKSSYYYVNANTYQNNNYFYSEVDSFFILNTFLEENFNLDSVIVRNGELCALQYYQTSTISHSYNNFNLISSDTTFLSTTRDSIHLTRTINIFPNPTEGNISIELPGLFNTEELRINIYNDLGELILQEYFNGNLNKRELDLSNFAKGIYHVSLTFGNSQIFGKKLIITH